jgi:hypothetical protein
VSCSRLALTAAPEIAPTNLGTRGQLYAVRYLGELLLGSRTPVLAACRALLARGIAGRLEVWRSGRQQAEVDILKGAGWMISEDDRGLRLQPWAPYPRDRLPDSVFNRLHESPAAIS